MSTAEQPSAISVVHPEPLLDESKRRLCLFPLEHADMWEWYKKLMSTFWLPEDISLDQDAVDYDGADRALSGFPALDRCRRNVGRAAAQCDRTNRQSLRRDGLSQYHVQSGAVPRATLG